jgi:hypothetical protein
MRGFGLFNGHEQASHEAIEFMKFVECQQLRHGSFAVMSDSQ